MNLSETPAPSSGVTRAPISGLKLMLAILGVFALLAGYGQWESFQRPATVKATIIPLPNISPSPAKPN